MSFHQCSGCHRVRSEDEAEFWTCSRCLACRYCSKDCQRTTWKAHKEECYKLGMEKLATDHGVQQSELAKIWMPEALRLAHNRNNLQRFTSDAPRTEFEPNPDTIYYILIGGTHTFEMLGPYYPAENLVKAFKHLLATQYALGDAPIFEDTFAAKGLQGMQTFIALLPFNAPEQLEYQELSIIQRTNRPVATLCHDPLSNQLCQVYNVVSAEHNSLTGEARVEIIDTVTTISAANEIARQAIAKWDVSDPDNTAKVYIQRNGLLHGGLGRRNRDTQKLYNVYGMLHNMEDAPPMPPAHAANHAVLRAMAAKFWESNGTHSATISSQLQDVLTALRNVAMRQAEEDRNQMSS